MSNLQFRDKATAHGSVPVPKVILKSPKLTMQAKTVYGQILDFAWYGEGYPGRERLAEENGVHPNTMDKYIKELKEFGLITVQQRGFQMTNLYIIESLTDEIVDKLAPVLTTNFVNRDSQQSVNHVSQHRMSHESQQIVSYRSHQNVNHESHSTVTEIGVGFGGVINRDFNNNTIVATLTRKFEELFGVNANDLQWQTCLSYLDDGVSHEVLIASWEIARLHSKGVKYALGVIKNAFDAGVRTKEQFDQFQEAYKQRMTGEQQTAAGTAGGNRANAQLDALSEAEARYRGRG